ncbi:MAG: hypothetical protein PHU99_09095 [Candidatus Cloacimonetes bacterium]|jgi:hypothetical protein|nr:hypothetical protein [Candidatus Cloacimonadota bacterium]MDY0338078.1 hypothetical protein [Candidatus Cloacimonadaceae bacterium]MCK9335760.1 hypothetical protein [Candidatus Cloacimonadota bacterium]MDD2684091.1 hypothetical protein [Candidatus Cloacimonadota bacterium]MDD3097860.1 hypothetical protein [Candidatus Cloacimonadota bacterium]
MNIFIRNQDNDLFKYLSDEDMAKLVSRCEKRSLKAGEVIHPRDVAAVLIVQSGRLSRYSAAGIKSGNVYPGELDLEAGLFCSDIPDYYLKAGGPVEILLCPYEVIENIPEPKPRAQIQAALNDSLCLKIAQMTHKKNDEETV